MQEYITIIGSVTGSVIAVVLGYIFNKKFDRQSARREMKFERYMQFFDALNGVIAHDKPTNQERINFAYQNSCR